MISNQDKHSFPLAFSLAVIKAKNSLINQEYYSALCPIGHSSTYKICDIHV